MALCVCYLKAGVGPWMAKVVESPWFSERVYRFSLEVRGHTVSTRKLENSHGDGALLPGERDK